MSSLDTAAEEGDVPTFVRLADAIDWQQRSAEEFARAVQLVLKVGRT